MAALKIGAELNFIDGKEWHIDVGRHGFNGCHPIAGRGGDNFFFPGDKRHSMVTDFQPHTVIDFAGEESQRQANHAAAMGQHPLNG